MTDTDTRPVAADGKPWEVQNTDQRVNASSYAVIGACGMMDVAHGFLAQSNPGVLPNPDDVTRIANGLLKMADAIQRNATGGKPNRQAGSHTRARGFLRTTIEIAGIPALDAPTDEKTAWSQQVVDHATALFQGAIALIDHDASA